MDDSFSSVHHCVSGKVIFNPSFHKYPQLAILIRSYGEPPNADIGDEWAEGSDSDYEAFGGFYDYINVSKNLDD
jgi:hypothetical protein